VQFATVSGALISAGWKSVSAGVNKTKAFFLTSTQAAFWVVNVYA
jgi:hypothetical protein